MLLIFNLILLNKIKWNLNHNHIAIFFIKSHFIMFPAKCQAFCDSLNVLIHWALFQHINLRPTMAMKMTMTMAMKITLLNCYKYHVFSKDITLPLTAHFSNLNYLISHKHYTIYFIWCRGHLCNNGTVLRILLRCSPIKIAKLWKMYRQYDVSRPLWWCWY